MSKTGRDRPPEDKDEWSYIWESVEKANDGWVVVGPLVAIVRNWKAWAIGLGAFLFLNRPDVLSLLQSIVGGAP